MKSQEYLNEQAELAQLLRDGMARGANCARLADLILQSDWLRDRTRKAQKGALLFASSALLDEPIPSGSAAGVINLPGDNPKDAA